jgi:hypothetical protein
MDPASLTRSLLSLPELSLRVDWLKYELSQWPPDHAARLLNALCEQGERSDPRAREALLPTALLFARLGDCPLVDELRALAAREHLLSLDRLLRRNAEHAVVAEALPVPDYGTGRELTLGERRSLARRPNRHAFEKLLSDPHPLVIRQLLHNPKLTENDVIRMVTRRPARSDVLSELVQTCWLSRSRVRMAVLLNPGSPLSIAVPLLGLCTRSELREVLDSADTSVLLRATARELFERRPPLREPNIDEPTLQ